MKFETMLLSTSVMILCLSMMFVPAQDRPQPGWWHGLILGQSTPEDAVKALGQPSKQKPADRLRIYTIDKWLNKNHKEKNFLIYEYKGKFGLDAARLAFRGGVLQVIELDLDDKLTTQALLNAYEVEFRPVASSIDEAFRPGSYQRRDGETGLKNYPTVYYLVGVSEASFISALVDNANFGQVWGTSGDAISYPGKVSLIQLVSRSLEDRSGDDVLR